MSNCPKCEETLEVVSYEGKDVLRCLQCRGFWFSNGLFREVKQVGFAGLCDDEPSTQAADNNADGNNSEDGEELACPDCSPQTLVAFNYAYSSEIQLHRCAVCKGIWANQSALADIERLLANYQESLEEAKAKALPLMMEVKRQFKAQEEALEAERRKKKKRGFIGKLFRKKAETEQKTVNVFADIRSEAGMSIDAESQTDADVRTDNEQGQE